MLKLRLFDDVQIFQEEKVEGEVVFLKVVFSRKTDTFQMVLQKASEHLSTKTLMTFLKNILTKGGIVTDDQRSLQKLKSKGLCRKKVSWMLALR